MLEGKERIWSCKIGGIVGELPSGSDWPMRQAIRRAFQELTGRDASFVFSGWAATLTHGEREMLGDYCQVQDCPAFEKDMVGHTHETHPR